MLKRIFSAIVLGTLVFWSWPVLATDYSSTDFTVKDSVIAPGSGFATSSDYQLWSSFGQLGIGLSATGDFGLESGFLYFPAPQAATTTPPVVTTPPNIFAGASSILPPSQLKLGVLPCDFNHDGKCDILDLSILLYYYGKTGPQIVPYDLGHFGVIDIRDLSILFYYWSETL